MPPPDPSPELLHRAGRTAGSAVAAWHPVRGGCTAAGRWVLQFADGNSAFLKAATDAQTAGWLRDEARVYQRLLTDFLPRLIGWDEEGEWPLLLVEDLSAAGWPPPWTPARIDAVLATLAAVRSAPPPPGLPRLEDRRESLSGWRRIEAEPEPFLALGLCGREWLEAALPDLFAAEAAAPLGGPDLLHRDVRSDNLCLRDGRAVLVDWNHAAVGYGPADVVAWLPSLEMEGGPRPETLLSGEPELVALHAGYWASRAGLPPPFPGATVRELQLKQLRSALPWTVRVLGLPAPR